MFIGRNTKIFDCKTSRPNFVKVIEENSIRDTIDTLLSIEIHINEIWIKQTTYLDAKSEHFNALNRKYSFPYTKPSAHTSRLCKLSLATYKFKEIEIWENVQCRATHQLLHLKALRYPNRYETFKLPTLTCYCCRSDILINIKFCVDTLTRKQPHSSN